MALIDLEELKDVLGIGDIYADPIVQEVADAAELVILSYLNLPQFGITSVKLTNNIAYFYTDSVHSFNIGEILTVTNCGTTFNGSRTVSAISPYSFQCAITHADIVAQVLKPWGKAIVTAKATMFDTDPRAREAALSVAADIWIGRQGQMGQQGIDFQPAPYRMGRAILSRVQGLLGAITDPNAMVG